VSRPLPRVSGQRFGRLLERRGFAVQSRKGSHVTYKHPERPLLVTVPMHRELRTGLVRRLMRDAGISREELLEEL
jgi:predicted RNA binding protein YcfA (HicA-like mRNA interferase family)